MNKYVLYHLMIFILSVGLFMLNILTKNTTVIYLSGFTAIISFILTLIYFKDSN